MTVAENAARTTAASPVRDATYDVARGLGMILVIYGHLLEAIFPAQPDRPVMMLGLYQWQAIYSFHMLLFFLVSGLVNRSLPEKSFPEALKASLRLLFLAFIVHLIGAVVSIVFNYSPDARTSLYGFYDLFFVPFLIGSEYTVGVLWFLTSLTFVQLMAWFTLRRWQSWGVVALAMLLTVTSLYVPNNFLFKTWFPGLAFFVIGFLIARRRISVPFWLCIPLLAGVIWLAPLNSGCSFTLSQTCGDPAGRFGVRMFMGGYGFLPIFYACGLMGSFAVLSLSKGIAPFRAAKVFAYIGVNSLDLFIINGFVATFLASYFARIPFHELNGFEYAGLAVAIVAVHVAAMLVLRPVLAPINNAALAAAGFVAARIAGVVLVRRDTKSG